MATILIPLYLLINHHALWLFTNMFSLHCSNVKGTHLLGKHRLLVTIKKLKMNIELARVDTCLQKNKALKKGLVACSFYIAYRTAQIDEI